MIIDPTKSEINFQIKIYIILDTLMQVLVFPIMWKKPTKYKIWNSFVNQTYIFENKNLCKIGLMLRSMFYLKYFITVKVGFA